MSKLEQRIPQMRSRCACGQHWSLAWGIPEKCPECGSARETFVETPMCKNYRLWLFGLISAFVDWEVISEEDARAIALREAPKVVSIGPWHARDVCPCGNHWDFMDSPLICPACGCNRSRDFTRQTAMRVTLWSNGSRSWEKKNG